MMNSKEALRILSSEMITRQSLKILGESLKISEGSGRFKELCISEQIVSIAMSQMSAAHRKEFEQSRPVSTLKIVRPKRYYNEKLGETT